MKRLLAGLVVVALLGFAGFAVFEHFEQADKIKDAGKPCAGLDTATPGATLPAGFALPTGQKLLRVQSQGKTGIVYASLPGERADLVKIRDNVAAFMVASGYRVNHQDQEPTYEADASMSKGSLDDSINVRPLCAGRTVVRYTLSG